MTMKIVLASLCLVFVARTVRSHAGHDEEPAKGETIQQYAQRHVRAAL